MDQMTRQEKNETFLLTSFLYGGNADYIEELYARYQKDPSSVDDSWQTFFARTQVSRLFQVRMCLVPEKRSSCRSGPSSSALRDVRICCPGMRK